MSDVDFDALMLHAKAFSDFTPEREKLLVESGSVVIPRLQEVSESFYDKLLVIPSAAPFLAGRVDSLKATHLQWLSSLFTGPYDTNYTAAMYGVGVAHVRVKLPVEFMAGGMCLIQNELASIAAEIYAGDVARMLAFINAVHAVLGFSLMIMQESYQSSSLAEELGKFLAITGMSRTLFNNLADAYQD